MSRTPYQAFSDFVGDCAIMRAAGWYPPIMTTAQIRRYLVVGWVGGWDCLRKRPPCGYPDNDNQPRPR